jgi:hypothetical protein
MLVLHNLSLKFLPTFMTGNCSLKLIKTTELQRTKEDQDHSCTAYTIT